MSQYMSQKFFFQGLKAAIPFALVIAPFGALFGVIATKAGLEMSQTMAFTSLVIAGASQFTAVQMLVDHSTLLLVILAALTVNLRMAMYSASLSPYLEDTPLWQRGLASYFLFDQTYVLCMDKFEREELTGRERISFFIGLTSIFVPIWVIATYLGAVVGYAISPKYGLDFALPITFIAAFAPMLRTFAHIISAVTSALVGLALVFLPSGIGLLIAALCAMSVGVIVENYMEKQS